MQPLVIQVIQAKSRDRISWNFRLDEGFADPSGCVVDAQGLVDGLPGGFGAGGFSHVQGAPVGLAEGGGDALLSFQGLAKGGPTGALTGLAQAQAKSRTAPR